MSVERSKAERYVVSACLAGLRTRYNGKAVPSEAVRVLVSEGRALPLCPEQLGGLPTPRSPAEIEPGGGGMAVVRGAARVLDRDGRDVTGAFLRGAQEALALARLFGARKAILKSLSPSCGLGRIYDGRFSGRIAVGDGVTAALLKAEGFDLVTEEDLQG